jgi:uncharacterized membrane protein
MGAGGAHEPAWSPMDAVTFGWNVVTKRFSTVALPLGVAWFVTLLVAYTPFVFGAVVVDTLTARGALDNDVGSIVKLSSFGVGGIVGLFVMSYMIGGIASTALKAARGQPTTFGDPFSGGRFFVPCLTASIVASVAYTIGAALCLIPGLIVACGVCLFPLLIVDQGLSGVDALKRSWEMTKGHRLNLFLLWIVMFFVVLAGELACLFGALLISYPIGMIAGAWIYLRIKGEPIPQPA